MKRIYSEENFRKITRRILKEEVLPLENGEFEEKGYRILTCRAGGDYIVCRENEHGAVAFIHGDAFAVEIFEDDTNLKQIMLNFATVWENLVNRGLLNECVEVIIKMCYPT